MESIWNDTVLNLKTQTCCEALSFTCAKRCMKPTKAQRCQNIELSMLSDANIPGKGNKISMAWADKASMMLRKVLKLKRWQNLQTVMRVNCHGITSFTPSSSSAVSNGWQISLTKRTTRVLHRAWTFPRFQKGSEQKSYTSHESRKLHETLASFQGFKPPKPGSSQFAPGRCRILSHRVTEFSSVSKDLCSPESGPGRSPALHWSLTHVWWVAWKALRPCAESQFPSQLHSAPSCIKSQRVKKSVWNATPTHLYTSLQRISFSPDRGCSPSETGRKGC